LIFLVWSQCLFRDFLRRSVSRHACFADRLRINFSQNLQIIKGHVLDEQGTGLAGVTVRVENTSEDFRFAAAVASFGMHLRNSPFKGTSSVEKIIEMAENAKGTDKEGYRSEFIQLVKISEILE